jgi:O-acetylhomoserine (thiol)-lyase
MAARFDWDKSGKFPTLTEPYEGFHGMDFSEESTVAAFLLRARREGLRDFGACMSPMTAFQLLQGVETLPLRMERHIANTRQAVAHLARARPWPASPTPNCRTIPTTRWRKSCCRAAPARCSASRSRAGGRPGRKFIEALRVFSHLANVGDAKSLVIHPASTTHFRMSDEALVAAGIHPGTIRLSIGLEDAGDLLEDLDRGLAAAAKAWHGPGTRT